MAKKKLVLFRLEGCSYCIRVEEYMDKKKIKYTKIEVPQPHNQRTLVKQLSGQASVPLLLEVTGAQDQDDDIIELLEKYN